MNATANFFPKTCCDVHKEHDDREPGLFKEEFRCAEMLCLCSKTLCCYNEQTNKHKFSSKGLNRRTLEEFGDGGVMSTYHKVLEKAVNVSSTNKDFRSIQRSVATNERTKKGLSYFYPKKLIRRRWNTHKFLTFVNFDYSFNCLSILILSINFFKLLHITRSFHVALSQNSIRARNEISARIINYSQA